MDIVRAEHVYKKFNTQVALEDVSISIREGSVFGLLGPNGAGKTTLIRIINQITAPDEGKLFFGDHQLCSNDIAYIGYLPEERGLYRKMKVGEQALYLAQLKGLSKADAWQRLKYWFEKFEIQGWWNKKIEELSKGMQQKVQFIVTVLHEPKLLIFDEPFSGFDPINTNLIKKEMLNLKEKGASIILSTHNMSSVEELCDDIALINKSKVILSGNVEEIRKDFKPNVYEVTFEGEIEKLKASLNDHYEVIEEKKNHHLNTALIRIYNHTVENELLSLIMPSVHITSFNELIPGMNDIFIKVVEQYNRQSQTSTIA